MEAYRVRVPLRWVDLDAQGHANNASILDYLQEARVDFLLNSPQGHLLGDGIIVVEHRVEYLGPVWFGGEDVDVDLWVGRVGAAQFDLGYEVFQGERLVARARTLMANFDFAAHRPARLARRSGPGSPSAAPSWTPSRPWATSGSGTATTGTRSRCAGPTSTPTATSTTWCSSTTSPRRGSP
ncbi:acyl-CoA thioesterase [Propioniciclava coleopterorum]|uniref:Acyl-CoA thioesterase n=1 Tax=Propioniciclava coleopterorum TaxID=2714937 RepID=A0A6G7Y3J1_9ACTN|nr:thioesterase family protein [Propioniciclava coleopterorum]QIK71191.1 acyl-CoA thioesterase [Propioniciclava coleopterorum]